MNARMWSGVLVCFRKIKLFLYGFLLLAMFFPYVKYGRFIDEYDNIFGGMVILGGRQIYGGFYSQHTPLMYYLSALFGWLGADSVESYRVVFYCFLVGCFFVLYFAYKKYFKSFPLLVFPVFYILSFCQIDNVSHTILSEHIQALAMVAIFLELIRLRSSSEFNLRNMVSVSIASFSAVGAAFVSIYAVTFSYFLIFTMLSYWAVAERRVEVGVFALLKKMATIVFVAALPFIMFLVWYYFCDNLKNFYFQAYWLNRNIYAKYNGGLGGDVFSPVLNAAYGFGSRFVSGLVDSQEWGNGLVVLNKLVVVLFCVVFLRKNAILFVGIVGFVVLNTIRGDEGFHSIQYWALTSMMMALLCGDVFYRVNIQRNKIWFGVAIACVTVFCFVYVFPYVSFVHNSFRRSAQEGVAPERSCSFYVKNLLAPHEGFLTTSISPAEMCYLEAGRLPATKAYTIVPWYTELFEDEIVDDLRRNKTKIIFHNPSNEVWGFVLKNYAPKLNSYILTNYQELGGPLPNVYVRKDFYDTAVKKLIEISPDVFFQRRRVAVFMPELTVGEISKGFVVRQTFVADDDNLQAVSVLMATYNRKNFSELKFSLIDGSGKSLFSEMVDASTLKDNSPFKFSFPVVSESKMMKFAIEITAVSGNPGGFVTAWMSKRNAYDEGGLSVNGNIVDGDLSITMFYKR